MVQGVVGGWFMSASCFWLSDGCGVGVLLLKPSNTRTGNMLCGLDMSVFEGLLLMTLEHMNT